MSESTIPYSTLPKVQRNLAIAHHKLTLLQLTLDLSAQPRLATLHFTFKWPPLPPLFPHPSAPPTTPTTSQTPMLKTTDHPDALEINVCPGSKPQTI